MNTKYNFFIGYLISSEIQMHLNQSKQWNEQLSIGIASLKRIPYKKKEYLGLYIESPQSLNKLTFLSEKIKSELNLYCPKLNLNNRSLFLFPELFLS